MSVAALPSSLRARAERFFGTGLAGVRLRLGSPGRLGALAFARGDEIVVGPEFLALRRRHRRELLGHELAHVVQQRQGRARRTGTLAGMPWCADPALEREAERLGRRFASGAASAGISGQCRHRSPPVIQRAVQIGEREITGPDDLDETERLILKLTDNGPGWQGWAVGESPQLFAFRSSRAFSEGVQVGLHGEPLIQLRRSGLLVAPRKLALLSPGELRALVDFEAGDGRGSAEIRAILDKHHMVAFGAEESGFDPVQRFLGRLGLKTSPMMAAPGLRGWVALDGLRRAVRETRRSSSLQKRAAAFAIERAAGIAAFVDYCNFFLAVHDSVDGRAEPILEETAGRLATELLPHVWEMLRCPRTDGELSCEAATEFLRYFLSTGNTIGFPSTSVALAQIASGTREWGGRHPVARQCRRFWSELQACLATAEARERWLWQDGLSWRYELSCGAASATLALSQQGLLAVERFNPSDE